MPQSRQFDGSLGQRQIRTFWCPVGMHNHAGSRAIEVGTAVLIVGPELCAQGHGGMS
jgi:hypothetical protein